MKLNKKGITSVELLICFIIISAIVVSMYNLILNYKNKEHIETINNEVIAFSNNLQKVIQNDLIMGHLVDITSISGDGHSASFSFDNPSSYSTTISIKPDEGIISYGRVDDVIDYKIPAIPDLVLSADSRIEYVSASNGYLKMTIVLNHPNFPNETYSFMINCPLKGEITINDLPAGDTIIDNLTCDATYDDGEDTFITSACGDPNNYVWYSGKLWKAISVNNEAKTTKLISQWNISAASYSNGSSSFQNSQMEEWLNDTSADGFLGNLREPERFIVMDAKWNVTETTSDTKPPKTTMVENSVGLLNYYEYVTSYRGKTVKDSYLNNGIQWWISTPLNSTEVRYVELSGGVGKDVATNAYGIRPVINLKSDVKIVDGNGTEGNPYRLEGDIDSDIAGTLLNTRYSGEYVRFGTGENDLYRIVSHEMPGLTKIVSAEPLKDSGKFKMITFGSNTLFSSTNTIGTFLNGQYLTNYVGTTYANMVENSTTWYLGTVHYGNHYKLTKYKDAAGTTLTSAKATSKVGLLRLGELLSGQFQKYDKEGQGTNIITNYWVISPQSTFTVRVVDYTGFIGGSEPSKQQGIRPAMNLKSNVVITGGDGTKGNPFTIGLQ